MADRERSSSPLISGQRTAGGGGVVIPPSQQVRSGALNPLKKSQNYAAKAAAARLAKVMQASRDLADDDDEDDDHHFPHFGSDASNARDLSPQLMRAYNGSNGALGAGLRSATFGRSTLKPTPVPPLAPVTPRARPALAVAPSVLRVKDPTPAPVIDRTRRYPIDLALENRGQDLTGPISRRETAALRDEIDILQEENEALLDKLRLVEEKLAEKETRSRELEKQQVASLGEGISLESRLLNRKEQFLKQREAAIRAAKEQSKDVKDEEIANLRLEAEAARDEAMAASEAAREVDLEVKALRTMTHRMILTQEEMEEVVLKRCWLARYWALAARLDIHPETANGKKEFWSSLAPLPLEVVLSAGQRAKEQPSSKSQNGFSGNGHKKPTRDVNDITGEGNIESMLAVEKGLRELASLKIEDAVMLALSRHRYASFGRGDTQEDGKPMQAVELSPMEVEDVQFKQAWLIYFWHRAKNNGVEDDIADERLQFWISRTMQKPAAHDEVDVERGLMELKRLGIEEQLWNVSRREIAHEAANQKVDVLEVLAPASLQRTISAPSIHNG
ncbi:hypothetical protein CY35_03G025600 [Sphagnum magellanicum]|nr:hypothetical protein CY35_03G025600 [Sphagnum magellanicum]